MKKTIELSEFRCLSMIIPTCDNGLTSDIIGLLPAGGQATRIAPIPCSKELFPIGLGPIQRANKLRPKVVSHYLLDKMQIAGVKRAYLILRTGKWDIPAYFGNGDIVGLNLAYLAIEPSLGVPYTLDQAYPFIKRSRVALGFPDIIFHPEDAFIRVINQQAKSNADIVLGLFPAGQSHKVDMVALDADYGVTGIQIKPPRTNLVYTWLIAIWTPNFTHFLHEYLLNTDGTSNTDRVISKTAERHELFMGDVIQAAIFKGLSVDKVLFNEGTYLDIGTPEDIITAMEKTIWE